MLYTPLIFDWFNSVTTLIGSMTKSTKPPKAPSLLRSCDHCRSKHAKCDGQRPCSNCVNEKINCHYSQRKKRQICPMKRELKLKAEITKLKNHIKRVREEAELLQKQLMKKSNEKQIIFNDIRLYLNASLYSFMTTARVCSPFIPQDVRGNLLFYRFNSLTKNYQIW